MEITSLIKAIIGLVIILGILVFILVLPKRLEKKKVIKKSASELEKPKTDLDSLRHIIRDRLSSKQELQDALNLVIKLHGHIPRKLGTRVNPGFDEYMEILIMICRHPNTDKDIILKFDKEIRSLNPDYEDEINQSITKGLDSRGI